MHTPFYRPATIGEATALLARHGGEALVVNGGTDIVIDIAQGKVRPQAIVYVQGIDELQGIRRQDGRIIVGGAVTYREIQRSPICQQVTGLMAALDKLGSPAVRAVATPAGNIGTGAPSADCTTILLALEAAVTLVGPQGERVVPVDRFFAEAYQTVRRPDEVIGKISFAAPATGDGTGYYRVARRKAQDIGKVLVGVSLHLEDGVCTRAAVSLGALNATAVRAPSVERLLTGKGRQEALRLARTTFPAEAGLRESYFRRYKELVTPTVVARAVEMAWNDAERRESLADGSL